MPAGWPARPSAADLIRPLWMMPSDTAVATMISEMTWLYANPAPSKKATAARPARRGDVRAATNVPTSRAVPVAAVVGSMTFGRAAAGAVAGRVVGAVAGAVDGLGGRGLRDEVGVDRVGHQLRVGGLPAQPRLREIRQGQDELGDQQDDRQQRDEGLEDVQPERPGPAWAVAGRRPAGGGGRGVFHVVVERLHWAGRVVRVGRRLLGRRRRVGPRPCACCGRREGRGGRPRGVAAGRPTRWPCPTRRRPPPHAPSRFRGSTCHITLTAGWATASTLASVMISTDPGCTVRRPSNCPAAARPRPSAGGHARPAAEG